MSLADTARREQTAVADGTSTGCGEPHPADQVESDCIRAVHLPSDQVHVGEVTAEDGTTMLLQWEAQVS